MRLKVKDLPSLLKRTYKAWSEKDPFRQSAVIAYYAVFSLPALLVLIITVTGFFFGAEAVNSRIMSEIGNTMGRDTADQIREMLMRASEKKTSGWAGVLGGLVLLIGATGVFVQLQSSLNVIWGVKAAPHKGLWGFLRARLFSFGLILAIAFLLLVSLVVSTALAAVSDWLSAGAAQWLVYLFQALDVLVSLAVISTLFALMFKFFPDAQVKWRTVWIGAILTSVLFILGKTGIAFYFGKADPGSGYGAAGSIVLVLLWVSYSSMILFFGAEFTKACAVFYEGEIKPKNVAKVDPDREAGRAA